MAIRVTTLPRLSCAIDGRELTALPNQKRRAALLVYLTVEREAPRDLLLRLCYPDRSTERGRRALNQALYEIRQELGQEWVESTGDRLVVAASVQSDAADFVTAVERGAWSDALALYGGPFLRDLYLVDTQEFDEWVQHKRMRLAQLQRKASRGRIQQQMAAHDYAGAQETAQSWARLDPMEEEAHQRIIELYGLVGRPAEAQRHFADYEKLLARENLTPLDETREILKQALSVRAIWPPPPTETASAVTRTRDAPGEFAELLPEYEVKQLLETGSVARVYVAREPALRRHVAIKVLSSQLAADERARLRFEREVQAAALIQHPNVAQVYRSGRLRSGVPYFVMPYIDGGTLEHRLAAAGALPIEEARELMAQLAGALAAAHRLNIVHRDVRPANILFDRVEQRALLTDFGIAAVLDVSATSVPLTLQDERLGHPAYVSPEQMRGEPVDERADVYSLGVVMFEMLAGRLPFDAEGMKEQFTATLQGRVRTLSELRPGVPPALEELVRRCMAPRHERRPFAADVVRLLQ